MIALHSTDFLVVRVVPLVRPIYTPFRLASRMPWLMRLCRSVTSFSDCSKAALICSSASAMRKSLINLTFPLFGYDDVSARWYIFDEIEFATDLGLDDVKNVDDEFGEIDLSNCEDLEKYGYHGLLDINPTMVFEHVLTKYLSSVYKIVFEDLF